MNKIVKIGTIAAAGAAAALALTACSTPAPAPTVTATKTVTATPEAPIGGNIVAPITATPAELKGTTQNIAIGQSINVNVDDVTAWLASSSDMTVATASQGSKGTATINPGFAGAKAGTATATLTNSATGETVTFTIVVK